MAPDAQAGQFGSLFCNTFAVEQKYVNGAEEPYEWSLELRRDLSASRTEIVAIKGVWARALRRWSMLVRRGVGVFLSASRTEIVAMKGVWARALRRWSMLVRREAGVFRRRMRRRRAEEMARLAASRRAEAAAEAEAEQRYQEHLYQVQERRADLAAAETDIAEGPRPFAWLSEGAKAVSAEMREASEELRALRRRAPGGRAPANYEQIDARIPRDADDFETVCAEWMRMAGFSGVQRTLKGPDGGVDVIASIAVGQAKFHPSQKISAEAIRALVGSRIERGKDRALFFHYGPGYTAAAIDAAVNTKLELYQLDVESQRFVRIA